MKISIVIMLSILLTATGCLTNRKISRNCDRFLEVCGTQTQTWVEYRDTVVTLQPIPVRLPDSRVDISLLIQEKAGKLNLPKQVFKRGLITVSAEVIDNRLLVDASIPDSLLVQPDPVRLPGAIMEKKVEVIVPQRYVPKTYQWAFWIVMIEILVAVYAAIQKFTGRNLIQLAMAFVKKLI